MTDSLIRVAEVLAKHRIVEPDEPSYNGPYTCEGCEHSTNDFTAWGEHQAEMVMAALDSYRRSEAEHDFKCLDGRSCSDRAGHIKRAFDPDAPGARDADFSVDEVMREWVGMNFDEEAEVGDVMAFLRLFGVNVEGADASPEYFPHDV